MTDEDHNDSCGIDRSWSYACRGWSKAWTFSGCVIQRSQCQLRDREPKRLLHQAQCCAFHCTDNIDNIQSFQTLVTWACVKPWRIQRPVCIEKGSSRSWSSESGWIMLNPTAHSVTHQAQRMKDAEDARPGSKTLRDLRASWPRGYAELWRRIDQVRYIADSCGETQSVEGQCHSRPLRLFVSRKARTMRLSPHFGDATLN